MVNPLSGKGVGDSFGGSGPMDDAVKDLGCYLDPPNMKYADQKAALEAMVNPQPKKQVIQSLFTLLDNVLKAFQQSIKLNDPGSFTNASAALCALVGQSDPSQPVFSESLLVVAFNNWSSTAGAMPSGAPGLAKAIGVMTGVTVNDGSDLSVSDAIPNHSKAYAAMHLNDIQSKSDALAAAQDILDSYPAVESYFCNNV